MNPDEPLSFTASVDGEPWAATSTVSTHSFLCQTLILSGTASNGSSLELFYEGVTAFESFELSSASPSYLRYISPGGEAFSSQNVPTAGTSSGVVYLDAFEGTEEVASGQFAGAAYAEGNPVPVVINDGVFEDIGFTIDLTSEDCPEPPVVEEENPETLVTWKINGNLIATDNLISDEDSNDLVKEVLYGTTEGDYARLRFNRDVEPGTFPLDNTSQEANVFFAIGFSVYFNVSGTLTITEHDTENNYIEGTFNAELEQSGDSGTPATISEGQFFITYED